MSAVIHNQLGEEVNTKASFSILEIGFALILFLTVTQTYRLVAVIAGIDQISVVTGLITIVCSVYIAIFGRISTRVSLPSLYTVLAVLCLPATTLLYAPSVSFRDLLLQLHYFLLFLGALIFFQRNGQRFQLIFVIALLVSVAGVFASIFWPALFLKMAAAASARYDYLGRGSGFFLQPNLMAYNLTLIMLMLYLWTDRERVKLFLYMTLIYAVAVFLTGSRGGMVAAGTFILGVYFFGKKFKGGRSLILGILIFLSVIIAASLLISLSGGLNLDVNYYVERIGSMFSESIEQDGSVEHRIAFQSEFLKRIMERPVFGYGLGAVSRMLDNNQLIGAAHNQFLDVAVEYGVLGWVFMLIGAGIMVRVLANPSIRLGRLCAFGIVLTLFVMMLGTNMVFSMQNFYMFLGMIFGCYGFIPRPQNLNS